MCTNVHSNIGADEMLYSEKDLEKSMDKIETINFHQVSHLHNLNSPILHSSTPHSSIPGGGCEWNQILVLQRRPCAGCGYVHDRDCRCEDFLHWRLFLRGRQTLNGCRDTLSISGCLDLREFKVAV